MLEKIFGSKAAALPASSGVAARRPGEEPGRDGGGEPGRCPIIGCYNSVGKPPPRLLLAALVCYSPLHASATRVVSPRASTTLWVLRCTVALRPMPRCRRRGGGGARPPTLGVRGLATLKGFALPLAVPAASRSAAPVHAVAELESTQQLPRHGARGPHGQRGSTG